jgi:hypothetical protein
MNNEILMDLATTPELTGFRANMVLRPLGARVTVSDGKLWVAIGAGDWKSFDELLEMM